MMSWCCRFPSKYLEGLLIGLKEAARKIGARYPITVYQNFTPAFPAAYLERAKKWGILFKFVSSW